MEKANNDWIALNSNLTDQEKAERKPYSDAEIANVEIYQSNTDYWSDALMNVMPQREHDSFTARPVQVHLHSPSEHTIDGEHYDVELHFVNAYMDNDGDTKYAVLTQMFDVEEGGDEENDIIKAALDLFAAGETNADNVSINFSSWKPDLNNFWHYEGGFTTPPCTEIVSFYILKGVASISQDQLDAVQEYTNSYQLAAGATDGSDPVNSANPGNMAGNNRKTQPLNTRVVYDSIDITTLNDGASALFASASALIVATLLAF